MICAVVFHCVAALFAWSYAMVIFTPPGFAPPSWHLSADQAASGLSLYKKKNDVEDRGHSCLIGGETAYCSVRGGMEGLALLLGRSAWLQDQAEKCSECCQILREVPLHQTRQVNKVFKLFKFSFIPTKTVATISITSE